MDKKLLKSIIKESEFTHHTEDLLKAIFCIKHDAALTDTQQAIFDNIESINAYIVIKNQIES